MTTYTRVEDVFTGHRFDVPVTDPRIKQGYFKPLNRPDYPDSTLPRPTKPKLRHLVPLGKQVNNGWNSSTRRPYRRQNAR